ncbi:hypothetical protein CTRU02_215562 [Colletotrichum truncatum]|uniref:Uncharacterized protein n=1 Tax=Colletotrichum truncatum TaxID=5467 RepID=A0ACC3YC27_COLTU
MDLQARSLQKRGDCVSLAVLHSGDGLE